MEPKEKTSSKKILIGINGSCNNDCIFCSDCGSRPERDLSIEKIFQALCIDDLEKGSEITLSGGEPSKHNRIFEIIECLTKKGYKCGMITNARLFSDPVFSEKIAKAGLGFAVTEIHSPHPEVHDFITQRRGSFDETLEGIKNLIHCGICVRVKIIVNRINYKTVPEITGLLCKTFPKITDILITSTNLQGNAFKNKELLGVRFSDTTPYIEESINIANGLGMKIRLDAYPICALNKKYSNYSIPRKQRIILKAEQPPIHNKYLAQACNMCDYLNECSGIWRSQIVVFGEKEVKSIKKELCDQ